MDRWFWIGEAGVVALLLLGLLWPPCFVFAGVWQGVVVLRAVRRAMHELAAYERARDSAPSSSE